MEALQQFQPHQIIDWGTIIQDMRGFLDGRFRPSDFQWKTATGMTQNISVLEWTPSAQILGCSHGGA